ncbi:MAG TPA: hypothetical protein VFZ61_03610 [Polyangiales bacterium]
MQEETARRIADGLIKQSTTNEQLTAAVRQLEHRLAIQPAAPLFDPRTLIPRAILVAAVAALVGSCTALAWVAQ